MLDSHKPVVPKPMPGEDWKTARGFTVRIDKSEGEVIEAHYMSEKAGGYLPAKFDMEGRKIGGYRPDWLVEREA